MVAQKKGIKDTKVNRGKSPCLEDTLLYRCELFCILKMPGAINNYENDLKIFFNNNYS